MLFLYEKCVFTALNTRRKMLHYTPYVDVEFVWFLASMLFVYFFIITCENYIVTMYIYMAICFYVKHAKKKNN